MDFMIKGLCPTSRISVIYADVTGSAQELERRHLSGATAGRLLGEMLTSAAILSSTLGNEEERIALQLKVEGPIGGGMVEASYNGNLRGYTSIKILNQFDGTENTPLTEALGAHGALSVIQSTPTGVSQSGQVYDNPPTMRSCLARYCYQSLQRPMGVELYATSAEGSLKTACGICVERMPDGDSASFVRILEHFENGSVKKHLPLRPEFGEWKTLLGLPDLIAVEMRNIQFGCTCSLERITSMLQSLNGKELKGILDEEEGTAVTCHFCGHLYTLSHQAITEIYRKKMMEAL